MWGELGKCGERCVWGEGSRVSGGRGVGRGGVG